MEDLSIMEANKAGGGGGGGAKKKYK